jgi:hypothetical protein
MLPRISHRRGVTSMLAMIYLTLIATLAVGFYASVNSATMVVHNDVEGSRGLCAAESGLQFMMYQLKTVNIAPASTGATMLTEVYNQLQAQMDGTGNLKSNSIVMTGSAIYVPGNNKYISVDQDGSQFRAIISQVSPGRLRVQVLGKHGSTASPASSRAVRLDFKVTPQRSSILNYGVAGRSAISISGGYVKGVPDAADGSIFTASTATAPVSISGSTVISGDVEMSSPTGKVSGSGSIAGIIDPALWGTHVKAGVPAPEFPTVDPSPYVNYLVGKETLISTNQSSMTLSNIRVKAGTNVSFSGCTINGVVLIEAPNRITFSGGSTKVTGVIVVDKPTEGTTTNSITFSGGGQVLGPENLPASYGELRTMTGAALLAPNFNLTFSGGSGTMGGSIAVKNAVFSGGSGGTINGTVMIMGANTLTLSGGSGFTIGAGIGGIPTGMQFSGPVLAEPFSYEEIPTTGF